MDNSNNNNKFLIVLVIILSVLVVGLGGYLIYDKVIVKTGNNIQESKNNNCKIDENSDNNSENQLTNTEEESNTFSLTTESGKVRVKGYATIDKIEDETGDSRDYVFFHILDTSSQNFIEYIKKYQGNAFVRDNAIGLGCFNSNNIIYENHSDQLGNIAITLSYAYTKKIIDSSINNPIILNLERFPLNYSKASGNISLCYSHITHISVVE